MRSEELLGLYAVGDQTPVPERCVELGVAGFGVAPVGVDELMGTGEFRDLLEVLGAVEAAFLVAFTGRALTFPACRPNGDSVLVASSSARYLEDVVPAETCGFLDAPSV
ncbi:hypothetical protein AB0K53_14295 [Streptomyces tuirus]|uniref:hypothetical protein n=1 Tax=Streptomyces tuirus TaxID=68278 RepID=UPI003424946F